MRPFTIQELLRLPRSELFVLHERTASELATTADGSYDRLVAHGNMRLIRFVLSRETTIAPLRKSFGLPPSLG
jgi:hypothetical protein